MRFRLIELTSGIVLFFISIFFICQDIALTNEEVEEEKEISQDLGGPEAEEEHAVCPVPIEPPIVEETETRQQVVLVQKGENLKSFFTRTVGNANLADDIVGLLQKKGYLRRLGAGQKFYFFYEQTKEGKNRAFVRFIFYPTPRSKISVSLEAEDNIKLEKSILPPKYKKVKGRIDHSVYAAAKKCGVPLSVTNKFIKLISYNIDFQRALKPGDQLYILLEKYYDPETGFEGGGELVYGALDLTAGLFDLYRFQRASGKVDFYSGKGEGARKGLLKTPVPGARLSSRFGSRMHPILGYTRMHRGIDFAAPQGTPILAAGSGVIKRATHFGSYGNYVLIQHDKEIATAYAHLSRFAKGMSSGKPVKQGQVIGYVGVTGRTSGPHLHYEVLRNGQHINPQTLKLPASQRLGGKELVAFKRQKAEIDRILRATK